MDNFNGSPLVYVVIPIHNGRDQTIECLNQLRKVTYKHLRVLVVDDGSTDGSSAYISENYPEVILLQGDGNLWWSGSVNRGIDFARQQGADFVCLLNNDNTFEPNFLAILVETALRRNAAAVSSKVFLKNSSRVFYAGGIMNRWGELAMRDGDDRMEFNVEAETMWAGGMGVLIKAEAFDSVGLFDEKAFPHYCGDADFYFRMRRQGYKLVYQPESIVFNDDTSTGYSYRTGKFKDLFFVLFSRKSYLNLITTTRFYCRHSPGMALCIIIKRIVRIFGGYLKAAAGIEKRKKSSHI